MSNRTLLAIRLPLMFVLLFLLEAVNLVKLAQAMSWTNPVPLAWAATLALGGFLVASVVALSFSMAETLRSRLQWAVVGLFFLQMTLVCLVGYIYSLSAMPAELVAQLLDTPPVLTRKVVATLENASTNIAAITFWGVLGSLWCQQLAEKERRREELAGLESLFKEERR